MEILDELKQHYTDLSANITGKLKQIEDELSPLAKDNQLIKDSFESSKSENQLLESKLKTRRDKKKMNVPSNDQRIKNVEMGNSEGNPVRNNKGPTRDRQRQFTNRQEGNPQQTHRHRDQQRTSQQYQQPQYRPYTRDRRSILPQGNQSLNYSQTNPPNLMEINTRPLPTTNYFEGIERELGDIVGSLRNFVQTISRSFPQQNYQYVRQPF